jgi:hypothetical protein
MSITCLNDNYKALISNFRTWIFGIYSKVVNLKYVYDMKSMIFQFQHVILKVWNVKISPCFKYCMISNNYICDDDDGRNTVKNYELCHLWQL